MQFYELTLYHFRLSSIVGIIGDSHYPNKAIANNSKGSKIKCFQRVFEEYSDLTFSHASDRPQGISGLEKRLQAAFQSNGQFGIFGGGTQGNAFFHRSLLWKWRTGTEKLRRIEFDLSRSIPIPSWSWMAYIGSIDYLQPPSGGVEWSSSIRHSLPPLNINKPATAGYNGSGNSCMNIQATTWAFDDPGQGVDTFKIHFDTTESDIGPMERQQEFRCVPVGKKLFDGPNKDKDHYLLLVRLLGKGSVAVFERVGIACMLGSHIRWDKPFMVGKIV